MEQASSLADLVRMRLDGDVTGLCRATRSEVLDVRLSATRLLGGSAGSPEAVETLFACLRHGPQWHAAKALGRLRERRAVPTLLELLAEGPYAPGQLDRPAGDALVAIGGPEVVRGLLGLLDRQMTDGAWSFRVLDALARLRPPEAVTPLLASLWLYLPEHAGHVVRTLGAIGDPRAGSALLVLAHSPASDTHLRRAALTALHALPAAAWPPARRYPSAEQLLYAAQRDPDPETARLATTLLARTEDGRNHLWDVLRTAPHTPDQPESPDQAEPSDQPESPPHAVAAVCAHVAEEPDLFAVPEPGEYHALLRHHLRESAAPTVRRAAARALSAYAGAEAGGALLEALDDAHISDTVADLVGRLADPPVRELQELLADTDGKAPQRRGAARALGCIGQTEATPALLTALADDTAPTAVRTAAADALGALRHADAAATLAALAEGDEQPGTLRARAVRALGLIGVPDTLPVVLVCARSPHEVVRARAVAALGGFPVAEAAQALGEFVTYSAEPHGTEPHRAEPHSAAPDLAPTEPHGTPPDLGRAEPRSSDPDLARTALQALRRIGAPALPVLIALADSVDDLSEDLADRLVGALAARPDAEATAVLVRLAATPAPPRAARHVAPGAGRLAPSCPAQEAASLALTERGTPEYLTPLTSLLGPDAWFGAQEAAVHALLEIGTDEAHEHVLAYCRRMTHFYDWHVEAVNAVAEARGVRLGP
ncbi:HEAT repeat domain-containing protein [Streptomyces lasiicapitis]|uniref:HEAT repeat domain-containing protein n=1 Tax=Streptomyces lasiicapitis TaxID=1923961 RepID=UPI00364C918E